MQSKATTVEQYLAELPEDRRAAITAVRKVILANLDKDYEEGMQYGMIGYCVPHRVFPPGYHCDPRQPLPFASLASQKNYMAIYLMAVYGEDGEGKRFREAWAKTGKKLDMGKSCVRFTRVEDLALGVIGDTIRRLPARVWIDHCQKAVNSYTPTPRSVIAARSAAKAAAKAAAGKSAAKAKRAAPKSTAGKKPAAARAKEKKSAGSARASVAKRSSTTRPVGSKVKVNLRKGR